MAKAEARRPPQKRRKKSFLSDMSRWLRSRDFFHSPQGQIAITCAAVLICLYIAVSAAVFHTPGPDETLLADSMAWESVFTQKTMRSVREKIGIEETDIVYLYAAPTATINSSGFITDFTLTLAVPSKSRYSLWELNYRGEDSTLHLQRTKRNLKQKDLSIQMDQLPTDEVIKTFLNFPAKYISQTFPLPDGGVYQFTPAAEFAVINYSFSSELSKGTAGIWISSSGGGSMIDAAFYPTGDYFTYYCTLLDAPPEQTEAKGKLGASVQNVPDAKTVRTKILVMTELSDGNLIL